MNLEDLYRLLRSGHVQAQGIIDTLDDPLLVLDQAALILNGNRAFFEYFRTSRDETIGRALFDIGAGQWNIPELRRLIAEIIPKSIAVVGYAVTAEFPPLGLRTMLVSARRLAHPDQNSTSILVLLEDVTEKRQTDAEKDVLLAETRHRMKNLLGVVRALATQTEVEGRSAEEYRAAFVGRLEAILEAEDLSESPIREADLRVLLRRALAAVHPGRVRVEQGPAVALEAPTVVPLSMIFHELITNAIKHGALSTDAGRIGLTWKVLENSGRDLLQLDWTESDGPPVTNPQRSGFGTRLIRFTASRTLKGDAELRYDPEGLKVRLTIPLGDKQV